MNKFELDIEAIRASAKKNIDQGAVTGSYLGDTDRVIDVLNHCLATEWICVLRYFQHSLAAKGFNAESIAVEFLQHSREEQEHAERIAGRINQLGGEPQLDPTFFKRDAHSEYETASSTQEMIRENLVAERIAINSYLEIISWLQDSDPTTKRMLEEILSVEEEHANDMADLLGADG